MSNKDLRSQIEAKLETALAEFGEGLSEKKFKKHIKKASKLLSDGLDLPHKEKVEKPAKKVKVKKTAIAKDQAAETVEKPTKKAKAPKKAPVKQAKKAAPVRKKATAKDVAEKTTDQ